MTDYEAYKQAVRRNIDAERTADPLYESYIADSMKLQLLLKKPEIEQANSEVVAEVLSQVFGIESHETKEVIQ